ncbi:MAG TPA: serine protease, partial [Kineosporiaceae bacterium]|nr:serine protease [Kineosporiaceae bacterium]
MSDPDRRSPVTRGWVAAIHASDDDFEPLGTGVVIDQTRVLTCAHVVAGWPASGPLWVAFPMADDPLDARRRVVDVRADPRPVSDVAVLVLDAAVPQGAQPAPLRCPQPGSLPGTSWWALGFARADPRGNSTAGTVGEHLGYGWVRLDVESRYVVERGLSGSALWSADYGGVIGIVGQGNDRGDGQAITLHQVDRSLPADRIRALADRWDVAAAGELALAAWGWSLSADQEAGRHWRPRARGVSIDSERGQRFRGRTRALRVITAWLDRTERDRRVLVLTGSPGVGKSAVLGRIVTTSDPAIVAALPADDAAVRATVGSVACAVHAKGKSALDVAVEIARAASAPLPERVEDLTPALRQALTERASLRGFNVVIDALDEAVSPSDARAIVSKLVLPLVETCTDLGAQVVVGTRRSDDGGDLLLPFGAACTTVDLDETDYFEKDDLVSYSLATLQL